MDGEMPNKVSLVTGSSRGIGRAIAIELAKNGIDIVVNNDKNSEEGIDVVK
jgi:enoyl-[acyl-carrier protein] reductase III